MARLNGKGKGVFVTLFMLFCFLLCFYTFAQAGFSISPYVQNVREESDGSGSAVIMWVTESFGPSRVDYKVFGSTSPWQTVRISDWKLIHEVKITGLQKGKKYAYKAYDEYYHFFSDERSFYAPVDYRQSFKFAFYSDPHDSDVLHYTAAEQIRAMGTQLVLTGGDYSENGISHFLKEIQYFYLREAALYPVRGNHDAGGISFIPSYANYFSLPNNERYYTFDYGNCHFIALDSMDRSVTQTAWLKQELINFRADNRNLRKWLVVYMHVPAYTYYGGRDDSSWMLFNRVVWAPLFSAYGVDLVFSGHAHVYEYFQVDGVKYIVSGVEDGANFCSIDIKNDVNTYNDLLGSNLNLTVYKIGDPIPRRTFKLYKDVISLKISSPKANDFAKGQLQITGRAMAAEGFQKYELSYARAEKPASATLITSNNVQVKDGILGVWDTSRCANGRYVLTLKATTNVKTSKTSVVVNIGDPFYRFFNNNTGGHFYTANEAEKQNLINNYSHIYTFEGSACGVSLAQKPGTVPFYRFYNKQNGAHFYTASESEKNKLINSYSYIYTYEGIACFVYPVSLPVSGSVPLYRFFNRQKNCHFYTAKESEKAKLINSYSYIYTYEGIACFVYPAS